MDDFHAGTSSLTQRVAAYADRWQLLPRSGPVVVAVSGGADSLCLLGVLRALCGSGKRWPGVALVVAHLDHGLRGAQGQADAAFVAVLAAELGLPCRVGARDVAALARQRKRGLEEAARHARYAFLREVAAEVGATRICVGHTRDDQVETLVMRWLRGSSLTGLAGMRPLSGDIARPLLGITRAETHADCATRGWAPREDASNSDRRYGRNRVRLDVLPLLRRENANIAETLVRAAEVLAADEDFLAARAAEVAARVTREAAPRRVVFDRAALRALEPAMLRRVILGALIQVAEGDVSFEARHILAAAAYAAGERTGGGMHVPGGVRVAATRHDLVIARRESGGRPRATETAPLALPVPGWVDVPGTPWRVGAQLLDAADSPAPGAEMAGTRAEGDGAPGRRAYLDADRVGAPLMVGRWRPGDRFRPLGMARAKKLQDFFVDAKVPRDERMLVPVVWGPAHIIWVAGHRIDDRVRVCPETRRVLALHLTRSDAIWHTEGSAEPAP